MINALKLAGTQAPVRIYRAGSRNRVPAGRVPANLQAPAIGCLQACRHPAGTQKVPSRHPGSDAGCLQAPCRHPAGTRGRVPGACGHPAGTQQASGIGSRSSKLYEKRKRSCPPLMLPSPTVCASRRRRTAMSKEGESAPEVSTRARVRQASTKLTSRGDCRAAPFNADS